MSSLTTSGARCRNWPSRSRSPTLPSRPSSSARTIPQLEDLLAGSTLELDDAALDRIDEIVPPGTDLADLAWKPPALTDPALRRRPPRDRVAGT